MKPFTSVSQSGLRNPSYSFKFRSKPNNQGFALILSLLFASLLLLLMVSMSHLISIEMSSSSNHRSTQLARLNAIAGLKIAVAELQKSLGPDQRVTCRADSLEDQNNSYTIVWHSNPIENYDPHPLISMKATKLEKLFSSNQVREDVLVDAVDLIKIDPPSEQNPQALKGERVYLWGSEQNLSGSYAWVAQDESLKANLAPVHASFIPKDGYGNVINTSHELALVDSSRRLSVYPGANPLLFQVGNQAPFSNYNTGHSDFEETIKKIYSLSGLVNSGYLNLNSLPGDSNGEKFTYFNNHFTVFSRGVISNNRDGGLRKDLSRALSNEYLEVFTEGVGGSRQDNRVDLNAGNQTILSGTQVYGEHWKVFRDFYNSYRSEDDFLVKETGYTGVQYHGLDNVKSSDAKMMMRLNSPGRYGGFRAGIRYNSLSSPYKYSDPSENFYDNNLNTNTVRPVLIRATIKVSARTRPITYVDNLGNAVNNYYLEFTLHPSFMLWNPYNFPIDLEKYKNNQGILISGDAYMQLVSAIRIPIEVKRNGVTVTSFNLKTSLDGNHRGNDNTFGTADDVIQGGDVRWKILDAKTLQEGGQFYNAGKVMPPGAVWVLALQKNSYDWDYDISYDQPPSESTITPIVGDDDRVIIRWTVNGNKISKGEGLFLLRQPGSVVSEQNHQAVIYKGGVYNEINSTEKETDVHVFQSGDLISIVVEKRNNHSANMDLEISSTTNANDGKEFIVNFPSGETEFLSGTAGAMNDIPSSIIIAHDIRTFTTNSSLDMQVPIFSQLCPTACGLGSFTNAPSAMYYGEVGLISDIETLSSDALPPTYDGYGFYGGEFGLNGFNRICLYDAPRHPLISMGDFAHCPIPWTYGSPSRPIGSSLKPISFDSSQVMDVSNLDGMPSRYDLSYLYNNTLFDPYFLSTVPEPESGASNVRDKKTTFPYGVSFDDEYIQQGKPLANTRFLYYGNPKASDFYEGLGELGFNRAASHLMIDGPFNVNSLSKEAWKSVLSGFRDLSVNAMSWSWRDGFVIDSYDSKPYEIKEEKTPFFHNFVPSLELNSLWGDAGKQYSGYSSLSDKEMDTLAGEIVEEIKNRTQLRKAPTRSLGEFINRDIDNNIDYGTLESAIRNSGINNEVSSTQNFSSYSNMPTPIFESSVDENSLSGLPGTLKQQDIIRALAPIMTTRGDTFKLRAYGEVKFQNQVKSKALCEATIQRFPEYIDYSLEPHELPSKDSLNDKFGRRLKIIDFRWILEDQ
jgi:hypothetical protein